LLVKATPSAPHRYELQHETRHQQAETTPVQLAATMVATFGAMQCVVKLFGTVFARGFR